MVKNTTRLETPVLFPKHDDEWHGFLEGNVETALKIREYVENRPITATTFRLKQIDGVPDKINDSLVKLTGSWPAPDQLAGGRGATMYVNPNGKSAHHYSDALVTCACGVPMLRMRFGEHEEQPMYHQDHKDHCTKPDRLEARARLLRNRADILRDAYAHGHSLHSATARLGYGHVDYIGTAETTEWGVDIPTLRTEGRKKLARTAVVLCREYSPEIVGKLFGVHRKSIGQIIKFETTSHPKALYGVRRRVA